MFEIIINFIESFIIILFLYFSVNKKHSFFVDFFISFLFFTGFFIFICIINYISITDAQFILAELFYTFIYTSLISDDKIAFKLFVSSIPLNIIGLENTIQNMTLSYFLFHKIDYLLLFEYYRVINVLLSQIIHVITFIYILYYVEKIKTMISDNDYYLITFLLFVCNIISISFESVGIHSENQDGYLMIGVYATMIFFIFLLFLFRSVYKHSINETRQKFELEIIEKQISSNNEMLKVQSELHKLKHDLKHFFDLLKAKSNDETALTDNKVKEYERLLFKSNIPITTISPIINYVLNIKRDEAQELGIDITLKLNITKDIMVDDQDLCLVLSNLLDNAIKHIGVNKKISIEMYEIDKMFVIKIVNSVDNFDINAINNVQQTHDGHGYGINTIRKLVDKYHGITQFRYDEGNLIASVLFPSIK